VLKGQPHVAAPAAAAAGGAKQPQQGCNSWEIPELPSLSAAVEQQQEAQQEESKKRKKTLEEGLQLKADIQDRSKTYDWNGELFPEVNGRLRPMDMVSLACTVLCCSTLRKATGQRCCIVTVV
jgi:hypothetical protein